jgi:hypothetical protein
MPSYAKNNILESSTPIIVNILIITNFNILEKKALKNCYFLLKHIIKKISLIYFQ